MNVEERLIAELETGAPYYRLLDELYGRLPHAGIVQPGYLACTRFGRPWLLVGPHIGRWDFSLPCHKESAENIVRWLALHHDLSYQVLVGGPLWAIFGNRFADFLARFE